MSARRTYWHLEALGRKPSAYEIATTSLLYYPGRGFEVTTPLGDWHHARQLGAALRLDDPDRFCDPRETTYASYTALQQSKEIFVTALLAPGDDPAHDRRGSPGWREIFERTLCPLRYPVHALQMLAAHVGHLAPGGRIAVCALFQAGDEVRRVQRLAYRMAQLAAAFPGLGARSREIWQDDPMWQPMREVVERLLVTFDWGEAFAGLNLALKPIFDGLFGVELARLAAREGDDLTARMLRSLDEDAAWHREWSRALCATAIASAPENAGALRGWIERWRAPALAAATAFAPILVWAPDGAAALAEVEATSHAFLAAAGVA